MRTAPAPLIASQHPTNTLEPVKAAQQGRKQKDLHDISSRVTQEQGDMTDWMDADPLLMPNPPLASAAHSSLPSPQSEAFFQLPTTRANQQDKQKLSDLLTAGLADIQKLQDPAYSALEEYQESDEDWLARTLAYAPDPDQFQAGGLHANVSSLQQFFNLTANHSVNARKVINWIKHGIKLPWVGLNHKSHRQATRSWR